MTKKEKANLHSLLMVLQIIVGLYLFSKYKLDWYYLFLVPVVATIFSSFVTSLIPIKKVNRKKKKTTKHTVQPKSLTVRSRDELLKLPLKKLNWKEFEELCYMYYKSKGMDPQRTRSGADGGVDLIVYNKKYNQKVAVQIKHWKNKVTVEKIRELNSAKRNYGCVLTEFITSSEYTAKALDEAELFNMNAYTSGHILNWREQELKKIKVKSG